jgi:hypothetical protein
MSRTTPAYPAPKSMVHLAVKALTQEALSLSTLLIERAEKGLLLFRQSLGLSVTQKEMAGRPKIAASALSPSGKLSSALTLACIGRATNYLEEG